ncbi:unnamed protein product [Hermetia illucens]|uniref:Transmembrane protein 50A n=1 Tax=Hermetia illucens TaxID=343691 RepID=A0A7R8UH57_HERIL|nr:transmembrane protein 50B [Hermetia illucens]CAD7080795.1 unnamed protein product [Hermetia illucens]
MSALDNVREWFSQENSRNKISAIVAGLLFFAGWWFLIDTLACYPGALNAGQIIVGVVGTISFFMVNTVKNSHLSEDNFGSRTHLAKIWLLIGFMLGFSAIIASVWIMVADFTSKDKVETWPGVAILLQNVLILISNLIYRFGRSEEEWSY